MKPVPMGFFYFDTSYKNGCRPISNTGEARASFARSLSSETAALVFVACQTIKC